MDTLSISKYYESNPIARIIVNAIPYIGGSIDVLLSSKWVSYQSQRVDDLLRNIEKELADVSQEKVDKGFLESEEFYDLVYSIAQSAISSRYPETRVGYAKVIRLAICQEETVYYLEDIVRQIAEMKEIDLQLLKGIKQLFDAGATVSGITVHEKIPLKSTLIETELHLYRFEQLGLLDHQRNMLNGRGKVEFHKTSLFDKLVDYLGL